MLPYDRRKAVEYARAWAYGRNPRYLDFEGLGGDCTNFVSQCIYAGSGVMNYTPVYGWYYITSENRTASWTGVQFFYDFMSANVASGPRALPCGLDGVVPGDVIQLGYNSGLFYHTLLVVRVDRPVSGCQPQGGQAQNPPGQPPESREPPTGCPADTNCIFTASHSEDSFMRRLSSYRIEQTRALHIVGVGEQTGSPPAAGL